MIIDDFLRGALRGHSSSPLAGCVLVPNIAVVVRAHLAPAGLQPPAIDELAALAALVRIGWLPQRLAGRVLVCAIGVRYER